MPATERLTKNYAVPYPAKSTSSSEALTDGAVPSFPLLAMTHSNALNAEQPCSF